MAQVQLFSKLKHAQQPSRPSHQPIHPSMQVPVQQKKWTIKGDGVGDFPELTYQQIQSIVDLVVQKSRLVAEKCLRFGKGVKQVMQDQVVSGLEWEIYSILTNLPVIDQHKSECLDNIIDELTQHQNQKFKNLDSTAQYYGSPNPQNFSFNNLNNSNSNNSTQIQQLSTIKYISSPQVCISNAESTLNRELEEKGRKNQGQDIKVVEFTLGNLGDTQPNEESQEVKEVKEIKESKQVCMEGEGGDWGKRGFVDDSFGVKRSEGADSLRKSITKLGVKPNNELCFSRKKVPKGKTIKIRVMGNAGNANDKVTSHQ